jgi:hypothetical protein
MAVVRRLEMLVNGRVATAEAARAGKHRRRVEAAARPKSEQTLHSRHELGAFGSAEEAFPLTTDVASAYMKATPAPDARSETIRQAG